MGTVSNSNLITVKLEKVHTHAGTEYQPGDEIDVSEIEAKFLLNSKVIKEIPAAGKNKA